jgi:DNA-binding response OmpR family regulator
MNETILIVEDRQDTSNLLMFALQKSGYVTLQAENAKKALQTLASHRISLIILDLMLPDLSGKEFIKRLRANEKYCNIKIMILTAAKIIETEQQKILEMGAQRFLFKPMEIKRIRKEIQNVLEE